mmetsp:Transcript_41211/g.94789  ORF Transcript_41211/g.94789 Transcript_41211/m.94789 type:complete len:324 (-) Transcript_41211:80-1051(-)
MQYIHSETETLPCMRPDMNQVWLPAPEAFTTAIVLVLALAVYTLYSRRRWLRKEKSEKTSRPASIFPRQVSARPRHETLIAALPEEVLCEVITFMGLKDASAVGTVNRKLGSQLWDDAEVWIALGPHHGLQLPLPGTCRTPGAMRQVFRRMAHRIDENFLHVMGAGLRSSSLGDAQIEMFLQEAQHMARGLLPCDGTDVVQVLSQSIEQALLLHDHTNKGMATAVEQFMDLARRRSDVFTFAELELFEHAIENAVTLTGLLDASMNKGQEVSPRSFGCSSLPLLEVDSDELAGYQEDEPFELQRMQLLDHLFEELERAYEAAS